MIKPDGSDPYGDQLHSRSSSRWRLTVIDNSTDRAQHHTDGRNTVIRQSLPHPSISANRNTDVMTPPEERECFCLCLTLTSHGALTRWARAGICNLSATWSSCRDFRQADGPCLRFSFGLATGVHLYKENI